MTRSACATEKVRSKVKKWGVDEAALLQTLVADSKQINWNSIQQSFPNRSLSSIQSFYKANVKPKYQNMKRHNFWTANDLSVLKQYVKENKIGKWVYWNKVKNFLPKYTVDQC